MIICKTTHILKQTIAKAKNKDIIGFVPTMGALHQGHLTLINESKQKATLTVCSIFVNPTQFNDKKDFEKYPITLEQDIFLLAQAGCDILFLPHVQEVYPDGLQKLSYYPLDYLEEILEGKYRKGHFQGVCNVVEKLLKMVEPSILFLGQKDYQQCMVITKLVQLMQWNNKLQINIVPTIRETSGLAMSSRNARLSDTAKQQATAIYTALQFIQNNIKHTPIALLVEQASKILLDAGFEKIDYVSICRADNLLPVEVYQPTENYVALIAAFINNVRLIDNLLLSNNR
jgi:pantoate--beta-alanine ligase